MPGLAPLVFAGGRHLHCPPVQPSPFLLPVSAQLHRYLIETAERGPEQIQKGDLLMQKTQLKTNRLGTTGLEISRVGFGAWAIGGGGWELGWEPQDDDESLAAVRRAAECGANWIRLPAARVSTAISGLPAMDRRQKVDGERDPASDREGNEHASRAAARNSMPASRRPGGDQ
jgi:hypothetical protein